MYTEKKLHDLIKRHRKGKCTPEEIEILGRAHNLSVSESQVDPTVLDDFALMNRIWNNVKPERYKSGKIVGMPKSAISVAASILLLVVGTVFFLTKTGNKGHTIAGVLPGPPGLHQPTRATLELSNGQTIYLSDKQPGEISKFGGIAVTKSDSGQITFNIYDKEQLSKNGKYKVSVPNGSGYKVSFIEGSNVILGPNSTITFHPGFNGEKRTIKLTGAADFEVVQNSGKPFEVVIPGQIITVLGTHFNVSSYAHEKEVTALLSGKVSVASRDTANKETKVLKPGQTASSVKYGLALDTLEQVYLSNFRKGYLVFHKAPLKDVLKQLARWYNVKVDYSNVQSINVSATLFFNLSLDEMLNVLNDIPGVNLKQKDNTITVQSDLK